MYGLAQQGHAPKGFAQTFAPRRAVDDRAGDGRDLLGRCGTQLPDPGKQVFLIIASIATFATVWVWLMILVTQMAMRRSMTPQEVSKLSFPVPWWPVAPALATIFMLFVIGLLGYFEDSRIALYVGLVWVAFLTLAYWLWVRKKGGGSPVTSSPQY
jgi:histidine transporter